MIPYSNSWTSIFVNVLHRAATQSPVLSSMTPVVIATPVSWNLPSTPIHRTNDLSVGFYTANDVSQNVPNCFLLFQATS